MVIRDGTGMVRMVADRLGFHVVITAAVATGEAEGSTVAEEAMVVAAVTEADKGQLQEY
jgi:hypothetical protein